VTTKSSKFFEIGNKNGIEYSNSSINDRKSKVRRFSYDRYVTRDLTKEHYLDILFLIGENDGLSSTQIVDRFPVKNYKRSKYLFDVIQDLEPQKTMKMRLFVWEDFMSGEYPKSLQEARKLYNSLNNILEFGTNLALGEVDNLEFPKPNDHKIIIKYGRHMLSIIKLKDMAVLEIFEEDDAHNYKILYQMDLSIKYIKTSNSSVVKSAVYAECSFIVPLFSYIKTKEIAGSKLYFLNGLGFFLLLTSKQHVAKIKDIITNSSIVDEIPFLKNWSIFNDLGFNIVKELERLGELYKLQITKCDNYDLLLYRIIEKYYTELMAHFGSMQFFGMLKNLNIKVKYQQMCKDKILESFIKQMLEKQRIVLQREIDRISNSDPALVKISFDTPGISVAGSYKLSEII
jgi:hypothetical protein